MGNRMSSLPIVQFCSGAGQLGQQYAAGRAAAMSTAFHAWASGQDEGDELMNLLSDKEQETVKEWNVPDDVDLDDGEVLRYSEATCEEEVMMDENGEHTDDPDAAVSTGHPDMYWVLDHAQEADPDSETTPDSLRVLYIGDMKKTEYSSVGGIKSLQLLAYAITLASKHQCDEFCVGIWNITEGIWEWSERFAMDDMVKTGKIFARVLAAANNTGGEFCVGPHCNDCYDRLHCKEWLLPFTNPVKQLEPFTVAGGITPENALEALFYAAQAKKVAAAVLDSLKAYAKIVKGIPDGEGKIWTEQFTKGGKKKYNTKALLAKLLEDDAEFCDRFSYKSSQGTMGMRWLNEKKQK